LGWSEHAKCGESAQNVASERKCGESTQNVAKARQMWRKKTNFFIENEKR